MGYATVGCKGSDVQVMLSAAGCLACCDCALQERRSVDSGLGFRYLEPVAAEDGDPPEFRTTADLVAHLRQHEAAGHTVPRDCYVALERDAAANDAWIASVSRSGCAAAGGGAGPRTGAPDPGSARDSADVSPQRSGA